MKYLDVLDEKGNPTGEKKIDNDVHRDGDWHRSVHVWIMNQREELLLQLRSEKKPAYPGRWDISAAGQVDAGEDAFTSALRETKEELGMSLQKEDLKHLFAIRERESYSMKGHM